MYVFSVDRLDKSLVINKYIFSNPSPVHCLKFSENITGSPLWSCSSLENTTHYFLVCPKYKALRQGYLLTLAYIFTPSVLLNGIPERPFKFNHQIFHKVQIFIQRPKDSIKQIAVSILSISTYIVNIIKRWSRLHVKGGWWQVATGCRTGSTKQAFVYHI